jgi:hypothetical protein
MTVQMTKSGFGMPTAISEIMRAKAAAAVEKKKKKESLLAGAVVAGSIVLGGIACQENNGGNGEVGDGSGINPNDSIPLIDTTITDTTKVDTTKADTSKIDEFAEYKVYMGDVFLEVWVGTSAPLPSDTIGWTKVYTKNGWEPFNTDICIHMPNGEKAIFQSSSSISTGRGRISNSSIPGYEGMAVASAPGVWREPQLDKAKLDAKKPDEQGL